MTLLVLMVLAVQPHRLDSRREAGAESCPDEQALQRAVAERLGTNPFSSDAVRTVTVRWRAANGTFSSEVTVTSETGATVGSRRLSSTASGCADLAQSTALALALIIDPLSLTRPAPQPPVETEPLPVPPPPVEPTPTEPPLPAPPVVVIEQPPAPATPPREAVRPFWLGASGALSLGEVPGVSAAIELYLGWRSSWVLLGGRFSFVMPSSQAFDVGAVSATVFGLGPLLCIGSSRVGGCTSLRLGATHAWASGFTGSPVQPGTAWSFTWALGPYVDFAPTDFLRLRLFVNGQLQPAAAVLVVKSLEAWRTPIASLQAGVGLFAVP